MAKTKSSGRIGPILSLNRINAFADAAINDLSMEVARPGEIFAANDSLINQGHFSEALTGYANGWRDPNDTASLLNVIAPEIEVSRRFTYREYSNAEEFASDADDARAPRGDFKTVEYTGKEVDARTVNRGLAVVVDLDEVDDLPSYRERVVARLLRRLHRNQLRRVIALIAAAATNDNKVWNASSDPDGDIETMISASADATGILPNLLLFGDRAWLLRRGAYRQSASPVVGARYGMTQADLAADLGVEHVAISRERYQTGAASKSQIVSNKVYAYIAQQGQDPEDPSNIKRFVTPCVAIGDLPGGGRYRVFEHRVSDKLVRFVVEHYELARATSTLGVRSITASAS